MKRRAFTLIEVMVALVLTGVVTLLAYGSIQAGFDTSDRLAENRVRSESGALLRSMLVDALRHPADPPAGGPPSFRIEHVSADGNSSDALHFVTRGVAAPLGAGSLWLMTLGPSRSGVRLSATPIDDRSLAPFEATTASARSVRVRVLRSVDERVWEREWKSARQIPAAIEISFADSLGVSQGPPLLVFMTGNFR